MEEAPHSILASLRGFISHLFILLMEIHDISSRLELCSQLSLQQECEDHLKRLGSYVNKMTKFHLRYIYIYIKQWLVCQHLRYFFKGHFRFAEKSIKKTSSFISKLDNSALLACRNHEQNRKKGKHQYHLKQRKLWIVKLIKPQTTHFLNTQLYRTVRNLFGHARFPRKS